MFHSDSAGSFSKSDFWPCTSDFWLLNSFFLRREFSIRSVTFFLWYKSRTLSCQFFKLFIFPYCLSQNFMFCLWYLQGPASEDFRLAFSWISVFPWNCLELPTWKCVVFDSSLRLLLPSKFFVFLFELVLLLSLCCHISVSIFHFRSQVTDYAKSHLKIRIKIANLKTYSVLSRSSCVTFDGPVDFSKCQALFECFMSSFLGLEYNGFINLTQLFEIMYKLNIQVHYCYILLPYNFIMIYKVFKLYLWKWFWYMEYPLLKGVNQD